MADDTHVFIKEIEPLDKIDADHIREFTESRGWFLMGARMRHIFAERSVHLRHAQSVDDVRKSQGFLDCLDCVLNLPQILMDEASQAKK